VSAPSGAWWDQLSAEPPAFGELVAHRVHTAPDMFLAMDHESAPHLLIALPDEGGTFADDHSRGIQVVAHKLRVEQRPESPFLDVRCADATGREMFRLVVNDIIEAVQHGMPAREAVETTLARWRRFWANVPPAGLSPDQVRGMFGELWFLHVWLMPLSSRHLLHWAGPTGARHDFQWPDLAVESKATVAVRGHVHRISGLEQLEAPGSGKLYFFSLRLREEASATNSLVTLVERITDDLRNDAALLDRFEELLARGGYSPAHADRYRGATFRVIDERLYRVGEGFPRITPASFTGGPPSGVERVEYEINLEACAPLLVARRPKELPSAIRDMRA
jgi:hypothetical protein